MGGVGQEQKELCLRRLLACQQMLDMLVRRLRQNDFKTPVFVRHVGLLAQNASTGERTERQKKRLIFSESLTRAYQQSNNPQNPWGFEAIFHESTSPTTQHFGNAICDAAHCWH
jgi:hypothetical protein